MQRHWAIVLDANVSVNRAGATGRQMNALQPDNHAVNVYSLCSDLCDHALVP